MVEAFLVSRACLFSKYLNHNEKAIFTSPLFHFTSISHQDVTKLLGSFIYWHPINNKTWLNYLNSSLIPYHSWSKVLWIYPEFHQHNGRVDYQKWISLFGFNTLKRRGKPSILGMPRPPDLYQLQGLVISGTKIWSCSAKIICIILIVTIADRCLADCEWALVTTFSCKTSISKG